MPAAAPTPATPMKMPAELEGANNMKAFACPAAQGTKAKGTAAAKGQQLAAGAGQPQCIPQKAIVAGEWEAPEATKAAKAAKGVKAAKAAKAGAAKTAPLAAKAPAAAKAMPVALTTTKQAATGTAAAGGAAVASTSSVGPSLGLGLGLGAWGPVILLGVAGAVGYGIYSYMKNRGDSDSELEEAIS
ncbi:hypothetical protein [Magnetococcus sp. PR-3]|uniref:hypothetical protein n=1 Tax=Magnetococcus sp. PR-3 TaxID=3120355 RepID=UPI002FCE4365